MVLTDPEPPLGADSFKWEELDGAPDFFKTTKLYREIKDMVDGSPSQKRYDGKIINGRVTVNKPFVRFFRLKAFGASNSCHFIFEIIGLNNSRIYTRVRVDLRQNTNTSNSTYTVTVLENNAFDLNNLYFGFWDRFPDSLVDVFIKNKPYNDLLVRVYDDHTRNGELTVYSPVVDGEESYDYMDSCAEYTSTMNNPVFHGNTIYNISPSNYEPVLGENVIFSITVTDNNGNPFKNHSFRFKINEFQLIDLTTNDQGIATYNYTCTGAGGCRFSIKNYSTYINVKYDTGWIPVTSFNSTYSHFSDSDNLVIRRTGDTVELRGYWKTSTNKNASTSATVFATLPEEYKPNRLVYSVQRTPSLNTYYLLVNSQGELAWSHYGNTSTTTLPEGTRMYAFMTWTV